MTFLLVQKCALKVYLLLTRAGSVVDVRAKIVGNQGPTSHRDYVLMVNRRAKASFNIVSCSGND